VNTRVEIVAGYFAVIQTETDLPLVEFTSGEKVWNVARPHRHDHENLGSSVTSIRI